MLNNILKEGDNSFTADTISRSCIIHRTSSSSSSNLVLLSSASVSVSVEKSSLKRENCSKQSSPGGMAMADRIPK